MTFKRRERSASKYGTIKHAFRCNYKVNVIIKTFVHATNTGAYKRAALRCDTFVTQINITSRYWTELKSPCQQQLWFRRVSSTCTFIMNKYVRQMRDLWTSHPSVRNIWARLCEKGDLMHVRKVSSQISMCSSQRLIRDDTFRLNWIFVWKRTAQANLGRHITYVH